MNNNLTYTIEINLQDYPEMNSYNNIELIERRNKVIQLITDKSAEACIITSPVNIYYLCGFIFDGFLYLQQGEEPILFVKRPNDIVGENVVTIRKPEQIPEYLTQHNMPIPKIIMAETDVMPYTMALRLRAAFGANELLNASAEMRNIRCIKSEYEIGIMKSSAQIHASVYKQIPTIYRKGMTDIEFQIEMEYLMRKSGSMGIFRTFGQNMDIFMGSILAGDNGQAASPFDFALGGSGVTPILPIGANGTALKSGTTLMVDMAGNYKPLMDDMTRSFAIDYAPPLAVKAHQVSIDILNAISKSAKSGTPAAELYFLAEQISKDNELDSYFMGTKQQAKFVGHGVGLEINEPPVLAPRSKEILKTGMSIAIEPKFVLPGIGPVGVENTYIVKEEGLENITICDESLIIL